ncbi:MAG: FecR domain-containing protein [Odoribacter sp.]
MSKMEKSVSIELIYKKIANELTKEEEDFFIDWIEECPEHRVYFERMKCFYEVAKEGKVSGEELEDAWTDFVKRMNKQKRISRLKIISRWVAVAASVVVVGMVGWFYEMNWQGNIRNEIKCQEIVPGRQLALLELSDGKIYELGNMIDQKKRVIGGNIVVDSCFLSYGKPDSMVLNTHLVYNKLVVPRGGEYQLKLADGTKVWLNSDTRLKYPETFTGDKREVFLDGEAYFEVAKDSRHPFIVHSGVQKVKVLGTCFGITCYADANEQYTTLVEGKVEIEFPGYVSDKYQLEPGKQILFDHLKLEITKRSVNVREFVSWKEGKYVFAKKRLEDMLNTLSRWYNFQVFYQNNDCKEILFSGEIQRFDNFNAILKLIEKTSDVKFIVNDNVVRVMRSN